MANLSTWWYRSGPYTMHTKPKITPQIAEKIRALHASGAIGYRTLATMFGLSRTHIKRIIRGEVWK